MASILHENGRLTSVDQANGVVGCAQAVNAAGAWSGFDSTLPFAVPIRPARGDIVALRGEPVPRHVVYSHALYVVPRLAGRLILGATLAIAGFARRVKAAGVQKLMTRCFGLLPDLEGAEFDSAWAGLRPCAPDQLPILGTTPIEGFHVATGHCRNGILLAPVTARIAADIIARGTSEFDLSPFSVSRFQNA